MKSSDLKPGLFIVIEFSDDRCPELITSVEETFFRTRSLRCFRDGRVIGVKYEFNAFLYCNEEASLGPRLLDTIRIISEGEVMAFLADQAESYDGRAREARESAIRNETLAAVYRQVSRTIIDEARQIAAP